MVNPSTWGDDDVMASVGVAGGAGRHEALTILSPYQRLENIFPPHCHLDSPYPGVRLPAGLLRQTLVVVLGAELLKLGQQGGELASDDIDYLAAHIHRQVRSGEDGVEMRNAKPRRRLERCPHLRVGVEAVEQDIDMPGPGRRLRHAGGATDRGVGRRRMMVEKCAEAPTMRLLRRAEELAYLVAAQNGDGERVVEAAELVGMAMAVAMRLPQVGTQFRVVDAFI